ncbi:MAG: thiamine diphosphokinase [Clostridia bacterium]|nr:thiamine diphosphokinase [Clostridia bacterium]
MTAYIVLNGEETPGLADILKNKEHIYCADGGANILFKHAIVPTVIVGDLDSINDEAKEFYQSKGCKFLTVKAEKDEIDGELIADRAVADGAKNIVLLCALGKRLDHTLGNIQVLCRVAEKGISAVAFGNGTKVFVDTSKIEIEKNDGEFVSLIPFSDETEVALTGFGYSGESIVLSRTKTLGISNYVVDEKGIITVKKGLPIVIVESKKR